MQNLTLIPGSAMQRIDCRPRIRRHNFQQGSRRSCGTAAVLLPVLKRAQVDADEPREIVLADIGCLSNRLDVRLRHFTDANASNLLAPMWRAIIFTACFNSANCLSFIIEYLIHPLHQHLALRGVQIGLCVLRKRVEQIDPSRSISPVIDNTCATSVVARLRTGSPKSQPCGWRRAARWRAGARW